MKKILILLATYNGARWLPEQIDSILRQRNVDVRILISDDLSADNTWIWLQELAKNDCRVKLLPRNEKFGRAAKNFYHLVEMADIAEADFFAYADQDDLWEQDKLIRQIELLEAGGYDGVSSDVEAFWENGKRVRIVKSQKQRKLDFLFESAGPGCTFLMTPWLISELKRLLATPELKVHDIGLHDWLTYAVCRTAGKKWFIDTFPTVRYRQHANNELGANKGIRALRSRLKKISAGWYYAEVLKISKVCQTLSQHAYLQAFCMALQHRKGLLKYVWQCRRKKLDRVMVLMIFCFWTLQRV